MAQGLLVAPPMRTVAGVSALRLSLALSRLKPLGRTGVVGDGGCWGLSTSGAVSSEGEKR